MAVPIDVLVRAGGSSLLAVVGVTTRLLAKQRKGTVALGALLTLHGLNLVYCKALRLALRDNRLSRDEEVHLHELATALGIPAARAHPMLVEVEREMGAR